MEIEEINAIEEDIKKLERNRDELRNCCVQKRATKKEIKHWQKGIDEYDIEIGTLKKILKIKKKTTLRVL